MKGALFNECVVSQYIMHNEWYLGRKVYLPTWQPYK